MRSACCVGGALAMPTPVSQGSYDSDSSYDSDDAARDEAEEAEEAEELDEDADSKQETRRRWAAENAAANAATKELAASGALSVGMLVERRAMGRTEWREGYIT